MFENIQKRKVVFFNLILPYMCVLLVPMLVWLFSNFYVSRNNEKKLALLAQSNIENNIGVVDATLNQIEGMVYRVSQDAEIGDFFLKNKLTYDDIRKYTKMLSTYNLGNDVAEELYIYSNASDKVIGQSVVYNNPEEFFRLNLTLEDFTAENWAESVRTGEWAKGYSRQKRASKMTQSEMEILSYARSVPIEYRFKRVGLAGIVVNEAKLLKGFDALLKEGNGELYVFNQKGKLIMSTGDKHIENAYEGVFEDSYCKLKLDGKKYYKFTSMGTKNRWQYIVFMESDYVLRDMAVVNAVLNAINVITLILGLLLCFYFTYGRNKSYLQIMKMLGIEKDISFQKFKFNEFEIWKPHLGNLISENRVIKENAERFSETEKNRVFHLLLSEAQESEESVRRLVEDSKVEFLCQNFLVLVLKSSAIYNIDGINNKNLFLKTVLEEYITEEFYLYIADSKTTAVIINYDMDTEEMHLYLKEQIAKMNLEVFFKYHSEIIIGVGGETTNLSEVHNSYRQALEVVHYNMLTNSNDVLFYKELPQEQGMYYYPIEIENRFIQALSSGNVDEALKVIEIVYEANFTKRVLSINRTKELFSEILSSINKVKQHYLKDEEPIEHRIADFTIKRFFEYIKDFAYSFCESIKILDEIAIRTKFEDMRKFINDNYNDPDISLSYISEKFGFTNTSYVSRCFKSFTNENFSSYIERIRIEKACEMFEKGMQIKDVFVNVGYVAEVTFRRAFKKRTGLSPAEYVKKLRKI